MPNQPHSIPVLNNSLHVVLERLAVALQYVNDVLFLGKDKAAIDSLKKQFMKLWECRDLGDTQEFLRMHIIKSKGRILVDQKD